MEKAQKSDPPDLRQVGSRLGAVAFFTFSLCLQRAPKRCPKALKIDARGYQKPPKAAKMAPKVTTMALEVANVTALGSKMAPKVTKKCTF